MRLIALGKSLILRACESFDFRSKSYQIWDKSVLSYTKYWGVWMHDNKRFTRSEERPKGASRRTHDRHAALRLDSFTSSIADRPRWSPMAGPRAHDRWRLPLARGRAAEIAR